LNFWLVIDRKQARLLLCVLVGSFKSMYVLCILISGQLWLHHFFLHCYVLVCNSSACRPEAKPQHRRGGSMPPASNRSSSEALSGIESASCFFCQKPATQPSTCGCVSHWPTATFFSDHLTRVVAGISSNSSCSRAACKTLNTIRNVFCTVKTKYGLRASVGVRANFRKLFSERPLVQSCERVSFWRSKPRFLFEARFKPESQIHRVTQDLRNCGIGGVPKQAWLNHSQLIIFIEDWIDSITSSVTGDKSVRCSEKKLYADPKSVRYCDKLSPNPIWPKSPARLTTLALVQVCSLRQG